jgi:hypothetical protein
VPVPELVRRRSDSRTFGRSSSLSLSRRPIAMLAMRLLGGVGGVDSRELGASHRLCNVATAPREMRQNSDYTWASLSSQPFFFVVWLVFVKPPSLLVFVNCRRSPRHASPGRQTGAAAESCRRNRKSLRASMMAMRMKCPLAKAQ